MSTVLLLLQFIGVVVLIIAQTSSINITTLPPGVSAFIVSSSSTTTTKRPRLTRRRRPRPSTTRIRNEPPDNIGVLQMILTKDIEQQKQLPSSAVSLDVQDEDDSASTTSNSSKQNQLQQPLSYHLYLLSLRWSSSSSNGNDNSFSKSTADIWRWKDGVLGDGRDYFTPKPKTLSALQTAIIEQVNNNNKNSNYNDPEYTIKECVVLSNCARFEILLAVDVVPSSSSSSSSPYDGDDGHDALLESIKTEISKALLLQVHAYQHRRKKNPLLELQLNWDSPDWIVTTAHDTETETKTTTTNDLSDQISELRCRDSWTVCRGPRDIANHLCHIAAGMAMRPRRPDRRVVFRPFSSRDAHILLQLKRTLDTATNNNNVVAGNACSTLLRYSLQAGKAARNPDKVPELADLKRYGSGDNSKYSTEPPAKLTQHVQEAVYQQVIDPTVQQAVECLLAQEQSSSIKKFRQRAESMACSNEELQWIRKRIHKPTLELRANNNNTPAALAVESLLGRLASELDELRSTV